LTPKELKALLDELKSARSTWHSHWQDIRDYIMPYRQSFTSSISDGAKAMEKLVDGTAAYALVRMAQGLRGLYTSEALPWFRLGLEDEDLEDSWEVKGWLEEVEKKFYAAYAKSNFYSQLTECYLDIGGFGTAGLWAEENAEQRGKLHFRALPLNQCYYAVDHQDRVNLMARVMRLTARQIQGWWPNNLGKKVGRAVEQNKWLEQFEVVHFIYPRMKRDARSAHKRNMPWASVYFQPDDLHIFDEGGFQEFPAAVARAQVMEGETYGRGAGVLALPDTKMLNRMEEDILRAGAKRIDPPLLLTNDALLSPLSFRPAGITILNAASTEDKIAPLPLGGDLGYGDNKADQKRYAIKQIFFNDLFETVAAPGETATAALKRIQKQLQMIGSLLSQIETELINPVFDRTFSLLWRAGEIPPPPPALMGQPIKIDYISPLAKAQRSAEAEGIMAVTEYAMAVARVKPEAADIVDFSEALRTLADIYGLKTKIVRSPEAVAEIREMRQQQEQQAQAAAMAVEGAKALPGLGKQIEPGSPLQLLAGGIEG